MMYNDSTQVPFAEIGGSLADVDDDIDDGRWTQVKVIFEEFYEQGDEERQAGRTPIAMMDRTQVRSEEPPLLQLLICHRNDVDFNEFHWPRPSRCTCSRAPRSSSSPTSASRATVCSTGSCRTPSRCSTAFRPIWPFGSVWPTRTRSATPVPRSSKRGNHHFHQIGGVAQRSRTLRTSGSSAQSP